MARNKKHSGRGAGDGSNVPTESVELDGDIITAAQSTMDARSYEEGYPRYPEALSMNQTQNVGRKR
jgi:hypothetical protein